MPGPHPRGRAGGFDPVEFSLFATKVVVALLVVVAAVGEAPRSLLVAPALLVGVTAAYAGYSLLRSRRRVESMREEYL